VRKNFNKGPVSKGSLDILTYDNVYATEIITNGISISEKIPVDVNKNNIEPNAKTTFVAFSPLNAKFLKVL
jgi:hypothetical protein